MNEFPYPSRGTAWPDRLVRCSAGAMADERGSVTIWSLLWLSFFLALAGIAVDTTNGYREKSMLQATADAAAISAASVTADPNDPSGPVDTTLAEAEASRIALGNLPDTLYGTVLDPADITVGIWDENTRTFSAGGAPELLDAVQVVMRRSKAGGNAVGTTFLRIMGLQSWDVVNMATAERFVPECINDGLIARGIVDMSSNNGFTGNICIHGQQGVDMQNNNSWQSGTTVSAPHMPMINGSESTNPGLADAKKETILDPKMVDRIDTDIAAMLDPSWSLMPSYVDTTQPVIVLKDKKLDFATMLQGRIYHITSPCKKGTIKTTGGNGNGNSTTGDPSLYASDGSTIRNIVLVSECQINIGAGTRLENMLIATRAAADPSEKVMQFASGVVLGADDNCAAGGGVQIWANGSIGSAAQLQIHGGQIVAAGDVEIAAQAQGIKGVSVQAGGNIRLTANNSFGLCGGNSTDTIVTTRYLRLVQ